VCLILKMCTPGIERVVHEEPVAEHLVIVRDRRGKAERNGIEPSALRRKIESRGVSAPDDQRQALQAEIGQLVFGDKGIEAAPLPDMAQLHIRNVVGIAPVACATDCTRSDGTYRNSASGSMNRKISHGQAIRSILGRSRVIHFIGARSLDKGASGECQLYNDAVVLSTCHRYRQLGFCS
jgi:hypothetical protein